MLTVSTSDGRTVRLTTDGGDLITNGWASWVYYEEILTRLRPGGLILVDNVLWFGNVANPEAQDDATRLMRSFNEAVAGDARVERVMLAVADGLTIARKL